jgi:hypothetical protein
MTRHNRRQINLRIGEALRRKLQAAAKERQISTNQLMRQTLEDATENQPQLLETRVHNLENKTIVFGRRLKVLEQRLTSNRTPV